MRQDDQLSEHLRSLETSLQSQSVRSNPQRLDELLADDFLEIGASGAVWTKQAVIDALQSEAFVARTMSAFRLTMLAADVALVTYRSHRTGSHGTSDSVRSSIWKQTKGGWRMIFHQGTMVAR